ncbi:MAG: superoxide dismutase [Desulfobacterales bacterium]
MNELNLSRRSVLTKVFPGAALAGLGLIATNAFAQEKTTTGGAAEKKAPKNKPVVEKMLAQAYQNGEYRLPELPYDYDALEPHISSKIMKIHHDKHHQGYVDGLNKTLSALEDLRNAKSIDMARLHGLEKDLSFNAGGHVLHTLFWATMGPNAGGTPKNEIADAIKRHFESFDVFKTYFSKVAGGVKGSGWALLGYEPIGNQLLVFQVNDHDLKVSPGIHPLLPLDVWEHAYYLQYENNRGRFIDAWWNIVDWDAVNASFRQIQARFSDETD